MFKPNRHYIIVVGLFFARNFPHTQGVRPLFMWSTPHNMEMQIKIYGGSPSTCFLALCGGSHVSCSRRGSASRFFRTPTSDRTRRIRA
nr:MAG TPA: hypothetical protein [Caudoviricetes sp.]